MNNGCQGPPAPGLPAGPQQQQRQQMTKPHIFKPEEIRNLPSYFSQEDKEKWENGLRQLWLKLNRNPADSADHLDAKKKLYEFSKSLTNKMQQFRAAQQAGGVNNVVIKDQQQQPQVQQQPQSVETAPAQPNPTLHQQNMNAKLEEHLNNFPYAVPPHMAPDSTEGRAYKEQAKARYKQGLLTMENSKNRLQQLKAVVQKRAEQGRPFTPEEEKDFNERKASAEKTHSDAKNFVERFRQSMLSKNAQKSQQQGDGNGNNGHPQQQPTRPQLNPQQQAPNAASQNSQAVNAVMEAARNQQMGGGRPPMPDGQMPGGTQMAPNMGSSQGLPGPVKTEPGPPAPLNTAAQQIQQQRVGQNNSPQSGLSQSAVPQSATSQRPPAAPEPRALSHQAALQTAARIYSSGQTSGTPNVMGHSHPHAPVSRDPQSNQNTLSTKMPIPKNLPERATAPPQPVSMPPVRPTYTGGPGGAANGPMAQAVMPKNPGYILNSEGEHMLNKKKLDELVRQVTGGGEGLESGEGLTAEVEESILSVADNFVDQVLTAACKNAKERGSKVLEIRDIQLTLERGYNIRIPGYASDEVRTVRKFAPTTQWISKMSALQAAKVTGGKGGD